MEAKKVAIVVISLVAVVALAGGWLWRNFSNVKTSVADGIGLYTQSDLTRAYEDGYTTALSDEAKYAALIDEFRAKIADLTADIHDREDQVAAVQSQAERTAAALLASELSNESKQELINQLHQQFYDLSVYVNELNSTILTLRADNYALTQTILILEEQKANLLQAVYAYEQLVASLEVIASRFVVTFLFDDVVYSILLVPDGEKVVIENPISTEYTIFLGWSLDQDGELVDLNNWKPSSDTVLYAKIIRKYDVNFVLDGQVYAHKIIQKGNTTAVAAPTSTARAVFKGWSLNGSDIVNVPSIQIYQHTTFFAIVEIKYQVEFRVNNSTWQKTWVTQGQSATPPDVEVFCFFFEGWTFSGVVADPAVQEVYNDKVYVAIMKVWPPLQIHLAGPITVPANSTGGIDITTLIQGAVSESFNLAHVDSVLFTSSVGTTEPSVYSNSSAAYWESTAAQTVTTKIVDLGYFTPAPGVSIWLGTAPTERQKNTFTFCVRILGGQTVLNIYQQTITETFVQNQNSWPGEITHEGLANVPITITDIYIVFKNYGAL
jgi:hypothetical protein